MIYHKNTLKKEIVKIKIIKIEKLLNGWAKVRKPDYLEIISG